MSAIWSDCCSGSNRNLKKQFFSVELRAYLKRNCINNTDWLSILSKEKKGLRKNS